MLPHTGPCQPASPGAAILLEAVQRLTPIAMLKLWIGQLMG